MPHFKCKTRAMGNAIRDACLCYLCKVQERRPSTIKKLDGTTFSRTSHDAFTYIIRVAFKS
jgi:hypothetical protein